MSQTYYAILTAIGEAKLANAAALGTTLQLTQMAVGDCGGATPQPSRTQTSLVGEKRRGPLNRLSIDPANASQIIAEHIIPEDVGGWWIRELGLYDAAGDLCAVANCPDTYKPVLSSGSGRTQIIRMVLIVSNAGAVELKIDPSIVLAPRAYVDQQAASHLAAADPHPQYATDADLAAHSAAADPHPQYLTSAEGDAKVAAAVAALVGSSPAALDTLNELAAALGGDPNFAATMTAALAGKSNKATTLNGYGITDGIRQFKAGEALPTQNLGPIWHADFNSLMTWQVFNANGANYTGYASLLIGSLLADTQPTPRAGYISSGSMSLSRTAYAALRGWAMHNGVMVAAGVWAAGAIAVADNADGTTFRAYDVRGEFPRYWDAGRGADAGRVFGALQGDAVQDHNHDIVGASGQPPDGTTGNFVAVSDIQVGKTNVYIAGVLNARVANETRPRNVALLPVIKF